MRNEELDRLKAKYWAGETSLQEERRLKELEGDGYFQSLKDSPETMDWNFEDFSEKLEESAGQPKEFAEKDRESDRPIIKRLIPFLAIAASLLIAFFVVNRFQDQEQENRDRIAQVPITEKEKVQPLERETVQPIDSEQVQPVEKESTGLSSSKGTSKGTDTRMANKVKQIAKPKTQPALEEAPEEEMYVEVNGVRIYDEEKALAVTEAAIQLATTNLKAGMKGIEKVKYLHIEI